MTKIILATRNRHKAGELKFFFNGFDIEILNVDDVAPDLELREDGTTFEENALQKAMTVYQKTGMLALADDSGLEVYYLNGRPGVYSARYAGKVTDDDKNNQKLLAEMRGVPPRRRRAQFRSVLALTGKGIREVTEGICPGVLGEFPRGTNGFGYDPIFIPDGFKKTYAELTAEEKNRISHRSRSFEKMSERVRKLLNVSGNGR